MHTQTFDETPAQLLFPSLFFFIFHFLFLNQRQCPKTFSTKEFVYGIVLQKFLTDSDYFIVGCILYFINDEK